MSLKYEPASEPLHISGGVPDVFEVGGAHSTLHRVSGGMPNLPQMGSPTLRRVPGGVPDVFEVGGACGAARLLKSMSLEYETSSEPLHRWCAGRFRSGRGSRGCALATPSATPLSSSQNPKPETLEPDNPNPWRLRAGYALALSHSG